MTKEEVKKILAVVMAVYPSFKVEELELTLNTWEYILRKYEYAEISKSLGDYIETSNSAFAPSVSQLIAGTRKKQVPFELTVMTTGEAWSMVRKALQNGAYNAEYEFYQLPELIRKAVGSPNQLHAWAVDPDYCEDVVMSIFSRNYDAIVKRKADYLQLDETQKKELREMQMAFLEVRT